jgi:hypothetical protein
MDHRVDQQFGIRNIFSIFEICHQRAACFEAENGWCVDGWIRKKM